MTRDEKLAAVWKATHRDYKGKIDGKKAVMVYRNGTTSVPLDDLTNAEIIRLLPQKKVDEEAHRLASRATFNNPVSIMKLDQLFKAVREALRDGLEDDEAVEVGRKLIASFNAAA
jgi:hypothetical protein